MHLSFKGRIKAEVQAELEYLKEMAQSEMEAKQACAQYQAGDEVFAVLDKGSPGFPYILNNAKFYIRLSRYSASSLPVATVQIRSAYLTEVGPAEAERVVEAIVRQLGEVKGRGTVGRVDVTVDFATAEDISALAVDDWITTAASKVPYYEGDGRHTGWTFGLGAATAGRLYDKKREIAKKQGGGHVMAHWAKAGYVPWDEVWRMEFEIKRATLARFDIKTVEDLLLSLPGLWSYLTTKFLRLAEASPSDRTRSRWVNRHLWNDIAGVAWEGDQATLVAQGVLTNAPSDEWLARQGASLITSMMAREGLTDPKLAAAMLVKIVYAAMEEKESIYGAAVETALGVKAALKARKYGMGQNNPNEAVARRVVDAEVSDANQWRKLPRDL